jgi:hypothetical protein
VSHPATYFWGDLGGEDSHLTVRNDGGKLKSLLPVLEKVSFFSYAPKLIPLKVAFTMKI